MDRSRVLRALLLIAVALTCFALSPIADAVSPAPDGGYAGFNTAEGDSALFSLSSGGQDTAIGADALFANTTGTQNTAIGAFALETNTTGGGNTATGTFALFSNTTGSSNTATGVGALVNNTTGFDNTANGYSALDNNTTGIFNTATGFEALVTNTTGNSNTATGFTALLFNTTGFENTADGANALLRNTTGWYNTATGAKALENSTTGAGNTAIGSNALLGNSTGTFNIGLGVSAGTNLTTGSNNIAIGNYGVAGESNTIRIGQAQTRTFINGISGVAIAGAAVVVNANGQLGVVASSADFKHQIRPMAEESKAILALKPVSFCYDQDIDENGLPQFGLVAEDVEKENPDLVLRDKEGKPYTVRYDAVNAMLLNEFLKEHRKVQEQEATIAQLKSTLAKKETIDAHQQQQIEALIAGLQKVSVQLATASPSRGGLEANKPASQVVNNP